MSQYSALLQQFGQIEPTELVYGLFGLALVRGKWSQEQGNRKMGKEGVKLLLKYRARAGTHAPCVRGKCCWQRSERGIID